MSNRDRKYTWLCILRHGFTEDARAQTRTQTSVVWVSDYKQPADSGERGREEHFQVVCCVLWLANVRAWIQLHSSHAGERCRLNALGWLTERNGARAATDSTLCRANALPPSRTRCSTAPRRRPSPTRASNSLLVRACVRVCVWLVVSMYEALRGGKCNRCGGGL